MLGTEFWGKKYSLGFSYKKGGRSHPPTLSDRVKRGLVRAATKGPK